MGRGGLAGRGVSLAELGAGRQLIVAGEVDRGGADQGDLRIAGEEAERELDGIVHQVVVVVEDHHSVARDGFDGAIESGRLAHVAVVDEQRVPPGHGRIQGRDQPANDLR